jgi:hypothetical protein
MSWDSHKAVPRDWRWLMMVLVCFYALLAVGVPLLKLVSEKQLFQGLGVAALDHPFMDLCGVTAWCDAAKMGKDPSVVETWISLPGSAEPHPNFLMNYAPTVLLLGKLGLTQHFMTAWGIGLALLYILSLWLLAGPCSLRRAVFWALLICSPSSVLAVERGNLDTLLFALLVASLLLRKHPWAGTLMILGAASLKFFPIAALLAPWREEKKQSRIASIMAGVLFLIFLALLHDRLAAIGGSLAAQYQTSFGSTTIADILAHGGLLSGEIIGRSHMILKFTALIGLGVSFALGLSARVGNPDKRSLPSERSDYAFFLTAPILLGLFVLGPQMDYLWIFFLFMVPSGLELITSTCQREAFVAKLWLIALPLYSYWTFFSDEGSLRNALLKQTVMGLVILLSAFLAGRLWKHKTPVSCLEN